MSKVGHRPWRWGDLGACWGPWGLSLIKDMIRDSKGKGAGERGRGPDRSRPVGYPRLRVPVRLTSETLRKPRQNKAERYPLLTQLKAPADARLG